MTVTEERQFISKSKLIERGWTRVEIRRFLGEPDRRLPSRNGRYPECQYATSRVSAAEASAALQKRRAGNDRDPRSYGISERLLMKGFEKRINKQMPGPLQLAVVRAIDRTERGTLGKGMTMSALVIEVWKDLNKSGEVSRSFYESTRRTADRLVKSGILRSETLRERLFSTAPRKEQNAPPWVRTPLRPPVKQQVKQQAKRMSGEIARLSITKMLVAGPRPYREVAAELKSQGISAVAVSRAAQRLVTEGAISRSGALLVFQCNPPPAQTAFEV